MTYNVNDMNVDIVHVTPDMAAAFLARHPVNRPLDQNHVKVFLGLIERNQWRMGETAVCVDTDGNLINGQHRLNAIVQSGKTHPLMVLRGLAAEDILHIDSNSKTRTAGQQLGLMGVKGGNAKIALCRAVLAYDNRTGVIASNVKASNEELYEVCMGDETMDAALWYANDLGRTIPRGKTVALSFAYYNLLLAWPEKVDTFHDGLAHGINLARGNPILRLRNVLLNPNTRQANAADRRKLVALVFKTFNYWVEERTLEVLVFRNDEPWAEPYTPQSLKKAQAARERGLRNHAAKMAKKQLVSA